LKVLEKSLNLNLPNCEILHLLTLLKQALVCMSPVLGSSTLFQFDYLLNQAFTVSMWITNKLMTVICHLLLSLQYWWVQNSTLQGYTAV